VRLIKKLLKLIQSQRSREIKTRGTIQYLSVLYGNLLGERLSDAELKRIPLPYGA
jgi:hypothetical protein